MGTNKKISQLKKQYVLSDDLVVVAVFRCIMEIADMTNKKTRHQEFTKHVMSFVELLEPQCKTVSAEKKLMEALLNYIQDDPEMAPFLKQMVPFIEWLEEADSDESDE